MAPVAGRPFVEWLLLALRAQGLRHVILATGYMGEMVEAHFEGGSRWGLDLRYAHERTSLGTGGAARHAIQQAVTGRILVLNGDSFCPFDVDRLADVHRRATARATLWLVPMDDCRRYGTVEIAADGRVVSFHEKSPTLKAGLINAGIYLFEREALDAIPSGRAVSLESEVFPSLIGRGLSATIGQGPFLDIGTPESYAAAESFIAANESLWDAVL
jgi:NDP-sugar pyrophosphorylase family protein